MKNQKEINMIKQKITGLTKSQLFLNPKIESKYKEKVNNSIKRLSEWEPIEYIINNAEFYSLDFFVDNRTLVPRDDTEIMVDKAIQKSLVKKHITLIDVWTWTSCIPISILKNTNNIDNCYVIDISKKALEVSKINIEKYWLENKIEQIEWSLLSSLISKSSNQLNITENIIITANLPYIKDNDFENMDKETVKFEPDTALYWWKETWFELYEELIKQSIELKQIYNSQNITLFIEIWFDQKEICENYVNKMLLKYEIYKDNSWINRCVQIEI